MTHRSPTINWTDIDVVLLDMDGTLLDLHYDNHFWSEHLPRRISERNGKSLSETKQEVMPILLDAIGTLPFYCIDHWSQVFDLDILAMKHEVSHKIAVRAGARELLARLNAAGKTVILATNAHRATIDLKLERTGLAGFFDAISCSHDYGYAKEHAGFWEALSQSHAIDYARSLFVDDTRRVLDAAARAGVRELVCIRQPDSRRGVVDVQDYPSTDDFSELIHNLS